LGNHFSVINAGHCEWLRIAAGLQGCKKTQNNIIIVGIAAYRALSAEFDTDFALGRTPNLAKMHFLHAKPIVA
jgi:hypothetical protein